MFLDIYQRQHVSLRVNTIAVYYVKWSLTITDCNMGGASHGSSRPVPCPFDLMTSNHFAPTSFRIFHFFLVI